MKTETYFISEGQFLGEVEPFKTKGLPSDSIIHKELTGCGATTLELKFHRNSIIIEPNLPVILGKCKKMNGTKRKFKVVLGVHDAVNVEDIKFYIQNRKGFKKILTTPEGFGKVIEAIGDSVYKEYFLLFDECEKAIQDIKYRKRIIDPIKHFFLFTNKAFVSATPLIPSDPRFKSFTHVYVKADYVHKHQIKVYTTNNIDYQLKTVLDNYKTNGMDKGRKYFIFLKSTKRIKKIIKGLKLTDHAVYCSETSAKELKRDDVTNAYDKINGKFAKYNFLTSRYFSAVDIDYADYACNPIIIMISDPLAVEHTVIDPSTEAVQIIGRFREPEKEEGKLEIKVTKDIFHLSNYNTKLSSFSETKIKSILIDKMALHQNIRSHTVTSDIEYFTKFTEEILEMPGFSYFYPNGTPNYFMIDYWRYSETTKGHYQSANNLIRAYKLSHRFELNSESDYKKYALTDEQLLEISDNTAPSIVNELVSKRLNEIMTQDMDSTYKAFNIDLLRFSFPKQMAVIDQFTMSKAATLDYNIVQIERFKRDETIVKKLSAMKKFVRSHFTIRGYTTQEIEAILATGVTETKLVGYESNVKLLKLFAKLSNRKHIKKDSEGIWLKGYEILYFLPS